MYRQYILLIPLLVFCFTPISLATSANDYKQQLFSSFEKQIYQMIKSGLEPLNKLDMQLSEESLYEIALSAEQSLAENYVALSELQVPIALPDDTRSLLEKGKREIAIGFKDLAESMNYYAQYIASRDPYLREKHIEKRDRGMLYVDGGLTTLATAKIQLDFQGESIQSSWEVGKIHFYRLEQLFKSHQEQIHYR